MGKSIIVLFLSFCQVSNVGSQTATIGPSSNVEVDEHNPVTLSCTYSGSSSSILTVSWLKDGSEIVTLDASDCSVFSGTLDASLYEASCGPFTWKIKDVDVTQDEKAWSCSINTGAAFDSASATLSVQVCPSITGLIANSQVSTTDRSPNTAVVVSCTTQVTGNMTTTCQTAGSWDPQPQLNCGTTTTSTTTSTSTTTTTSTSTTTTTTPSPTTTTTTTTTTAPVTRSAPTTTTTTTTTPATTTRPATTTTTTTPIPTTAEPPTTTTTPITTSSPPTTTFRSSGDSNKGLITMIIAVSVIGGILVIAIVFIVFVMVYWKSCLPLGSYRPDKHHHRRHHSHHKHKARRKRSEQSSCQPQNGLAGYSFYRGGVKNPVFQEGMEYPNSTVVYYKDADEIFHAPRYDEQPPEYQYAVNWDGVET